MTQNNSSAIKHIQTPLQAEAIADLKAGDSVMLSGVIYTARDKAHKLLAEAVKQNQPLPVDLTDQLIYYVGPAPAKPGQPIGSCGPTTSGRMDAYTPTLLNQTGLKGMLGKGPRSQEVIDAIVANKAVYLVAIGGTGVAISQCVKSAEVIAYEQLGTCAIRRLEVENLPCIVAIDSQGNNLYQLGIEQYKEN